MYKRILVAIDDSFMTQRVLAEAASLAKAHGAALCIAHAIDETILARSNVESLAPTALFFGALGLTAVTDNAALTYLGSLIVGISDPAKYMLVAGAVAGGGLTVIANAPNPAGVALLRAGFQDQSIGAGSLLLGALLPTAVAAAFFLFL